MNRTSHAGWGRCVTAWVAGLCAWILTSGCAWRLPSKAPPDLQRTLDQAAAMEDSRAKNSLLTAALHARVEEFQDLVERNIILREKILREANRLEESFNQKRDLTPGDLKLVSEGAAKYLRLRDELLALVDRYQCLLEYSEEELLRRGVDPRLRLVAIMVSVGAALTLYDNYLTTVVRFERSGGLRHYVNHGDKSAGLNRQQMEKIGQSARSLVNQSQVRGAIFSLEEWKRRYPLWKARFKNADEEIDVLDLDFAYLETLIASSVSYEFVTGFHPGKFGGLKLETLSRTLPDLLSESSETFLLLLTRVFIEATAVVEPRKGLLYLPAEKRAEILRHLGSVLKPGDILLEKAPFRLSDRIVPGYWGHAAIWIGTSDQLEAVGLWGDRRLAWLPSSGGLTAQASIASGRCVLEAVRNGVMLNTLEHFLNIDDLAVLRPRMNEDPVRRLERRETILTALSHLGKGYDFGFNVHTRDQIVCSELIFQSYTQPEFRWPKANFMGRYTISPDQVALRALPADAGDPPLRLIEFYHQGQLVNASQGELESMMFRLLDVKEHEKAYGPQPGPGQGSVR